MPTAVAARRCCLRLRLRRARLLLPSLLCPLCLLCLPQTIKQRLAAPIQLQAGPEGFNSRLSPPQLKQR
jgi:hypothetical protein